MTTTKLFEEKPVRSRRLIVRLSEAELHSLRVAAATAGVRLSSYVRSKLRGGK